MNLPAAFCDSFRALPDREAFFESFADPPVRGVRANPLKIDPETFARRCPFPLDGGVPWEETGFYTKTEKLGRYLWHTAGVFYAQEPSAMCAVPLLDLHAGERVLDLCAAPGGKGTQAAGKLRGTGLLVLNEKVPERARVLARNVERLGVENAIVLNHDPAELEERFPAYFDKVLADAPCSGEGMFRKDPLAVGEWSEEIVRMCAARQKRLLRSAAAMVKPGGVLVYSTCTFSEEEDEGQIEAFLREHPDFACVEQRKLYPHRVRGEGHFAAKLLRLDGTAGRVLPERHFLGGKALSEYRAFERSFSGRTWENLFAFGRDYTALPEGCFSLAGLRVLRAGLPLCTRQKGRLEPHHSLAMAGRDFRNTAPLSEELAVRYLRGEGFESAGENGWCAVTYDGFALGLGKRVDGFVKNHLPRGLRDFA